MSGLLDAFKDVPSPPSAAPAPCPFHARCARGECCAAFSRIVGVGRTVRQPWEAPTRALYRKLFREQDDDEGEERAMREGEG